MNSFFMNPTIFELHKEIVETIQTAKRENQIDYGSIYDFKDSEIDEIEKNPLRVPCNRLLKYMLLIKADPKCLLKFNNVKLKKLS